MGDVEKKQIIESFIRMVNHISDKEYQRKAWIRGEEADFDEAVCLFFGDGDPILENYKEYGITDAQYRSLKKLRDEFRVFSDENYSPDEFIDTLEWDRIVSLAAEVLKEFNFRKK